MLHLFICIIFSFWATEIFNWRFNLNFNHFQLLPLWSALRWFRCRRLPVHPSRWIIFGGAKPTKERWTQSRAVPSDVLRRRIYGVDGDFEEWNFGYAKISRSRFSGEIKDEDCELHEIILHSSSAVGSTRWITFAGRHSVFRHQIYGALHNPVAA